MVAADQFNQYVTTGETWQFLKLAGLDVLMDRQRYDMDHLGKILRVLQAIANSADDGPA